MEDRNKHVEEGHILFPLQVSFLLPIAWIITRGENERISREDS